MKQAKVVINHVPTLADGGHERVFDALACGCSVISTPSTYLLEEFGDGKGVYFFNPAKPEELDDLLDYVLQNKDADDAVRAIQTGPLLRHRMRERAVYLRRLFAERWPDVYGYESAS